MVLSDVPEDNLEIVCGCSARLSHWGLQDRSLAGERVVATHRSGDALVLLSLGHAPTRSILTMRKPVSPLPSLRQCDMA